MKRYGAVIELHPDKIADYKRLHAAVWPGVLKTITDCNIRNYSIFLRQFPDLCKPCQIPLANRAEGEWWADMEEVFHCD